MGRVKEAVLASLVRPIVSSVSAGILGAPHCQFRQCAMVSLAHPIVSSVSAGILGASHCQFRQCWHPWRAPLSVPSVRYGLRHRLLFSYIEHKIRQNIYTRIYIPE